MIGKTLMRQIEFKIKFITPLLIHGAESRKADTIGLTGKALRGCWRFWFRAMVGGMVNNIPKDCLLGLENMIFGSSDENVGAKFRMRVEEITRREDIQAYLGFKYRQGRKEGQRAASAGYKEGLTYKVIITPRVMTELELKTLCEILLATIWLWGNLGGIGNRARKGFGSPVIELANNSNPFESLQLPVESAFSNVERIKSHLCNGLKQVWSIFKEWLQDNGCTVTGDMETNDVQPQEYFLLNSLKQVAVCTKPYYPRDEAIRAVHGDHNCDELGWVDIPSKNFRPSRYASPVFIRFHKVNNKELNREEFLPIFTWCKQQGVPASNCAVKYFKGINFDKDLLGENI